MNTLVTIVLAAGLSAHPPIDSRLQTPGAGADLPRCLPLVQAQTRCCTLANGARCCGRSTGGSGISGCRCR